MAELPKDKSEVSPAFFIIFSILLNKKESDNLKKGEVQ